jgi:prolyl oligopeptidase
MTLLTLALTAALAQDPAEEPEDPPAVALPTPDADPHAWLEEVLGDRALQQVRTWNEATLAHMEADPRFADLQAEALEILTSEARLTVGNLRDGQLYAFWQSPENVRGVWRRTPYPDYLAGTPRWETLLDLDALAEAEGENWVWHPPHCADDSDRCLIELSRGGTDAAVIREFDLATGSFLEDGFRIDEAKSEVTMLDEDTVLVATDRGDGTLTESGYPRTVSVWRRGEALESLPYALEGEASDVAVGGWTSSHGKREETFLYRGRTFYETETYRLVDGEPVRLPLPDHATTIGIMGDHLLVVPREDWAHAGQTFPAGVLVAMGLDDTDDVETVFAPAEGQSIEGVAIGKKSVFVQILSDVVGEVRRLRRKKGRWTGERLDLPANGQIELVTSSSSRDDLLVSFESLTQPVTLLHVDKKDRIRTVQELPAFFDADGIVVEQRFATSADGTRVPYFLMAREDVLAGGPAPTIQYGYGGFQATILPTYYRDEARPQQGAFAGRMWVEDGGVLVLSNIRGGGEYGPAWHQAALKADRQRAYEDFFAIGEALVADGVTTPEQLGAIGRSNGGLLMGVVLTQRPDLYQAIDIGVPLLDMLTYDKLLAGASWTGEYGDPDVPEERATLASYSPYHNLDPDADYPTVLFYTSTRDDRVHPGHARKMAAALASLDVPFHYWENIEGGHGGTVNQEQAALRLALEFLYFRQQLGLD